MKRFIILSASFAIVSALSFSSGFFAMKEQADQDYFEAKEAMSSYIVGDYIMRYDVRSTHLQDDETRSWFNNEYNHLVSAWQRTVEDINDGRRDDEYWSNVISDKYYPYVNHLIEEVKKRDVPYKKEKIKILELRRESLQQLSLYLKDSDNTKAFDLYNQYDIQFREIQASNLDIVK